MIGDEENNVKKNNTLAQALGLPLDQFLKHDLLSTRTVMILMGDFDQLTGPSMDIENRS